MIYAAAIVVLLLAAGAAWYATRRTGERASDRLVRGRRLPRFEAQTEDGETITPDDLRGLPVVFIFLRGNWCPFCSSQVKDLSRYYREINDRGAKLVLVVPKPQQTTRRVAEVFGVDFTFWLDPDLSVARQLEILDEGAVPEELGEDYGRDTMRPTAVVVDGEGIIRYANRAKDVRNRPDPIEFLRVLDRIT